MSSLHISISAETVAHLGPLAISNSMLTSLIVSGLLVTFAFVVNKGLQATGKPSRLQSVVEMIIEGMFNLSVDITGSRKKASKFFPLVMTFFLFIMLNNWAGLLPGVGTVGFREGEENAEVFVPAATLIASTEPAKLSPEHSESDAQIQEGKEARGIVEEKTEEHEVQETAHSEGIFVPYFRAGTADLNTTIALALISVFATQAFGFQSLGLGYLKKFFNFESPIMFFVGLLELVLEAAKIMSFAFRLFGNIFAGEVLLAVMMFLVPVLIPMPFYGLEIFVGMIQAVVFSMLSLVFFNLATIGHGDEH